MGVAHGVPQATSDDAGYDADADGENVLDENPDESAMPEAEPLGTGHEGLPDAPPPYDGLQQSSGIPETHSSQSPDDFSYPDDPEAFDMLTSVRDSLDRLKGLRNLPPAHPLIKSKTQKELMRARMLKIGARIVELIRGRADGPDLDLRLW
jgi:hypothetical protein